MNGLFANPVVAAIDPWILGFSLVTVVVTIWMGFWAAKKSKTASDFFVAGRSVSVGWNASAISGEYLSAASFMGVAGMVMAVGYDALWYPVCYACGYLFLLLFIAGPLRRFGAYTVPDFAEGRFDSPIFRKIAVVFVLFIGFFYTMPQMKGAGTTLAYIFPGLPYWVGVAVVGAIITLNVALGGMKGITLVQAFQYWMKMFAISVPIFVLMAVYGGYGRQIGGNDGRRTPAERVAVNTGSQVTTKISELVQGSDPPNSVSLGIQVPDLTLDVAAGPKTRSYGFEPAIARDFGPVKTVVTPTPTGPTGVVSVAGHSAVLPSIVAGQLLPERPQGFFDKASGIVRYELPAKAPTDSTWLSPFGPLTTKAAKAAGITGEAAKPYSLLYTYSLIIALVCGTAGLPHILVRFYTNPDGVAAKRTTMWVMILIGIFYVFPPVFGVLGRNLMPELYEGVGAKGTDKIVLELPRMLNEKVPGLGSILSGVTCAGAFAAFMSTFSGLLVSMTGALAHDVYGRILKPTATAEERMRMFKIGAVIIGGIAVLLGTQVEKLQINFMVGQAFAIAAASYFPLLFMAVWWRKLTMKGAAVGMLFGGLLAVFSITLTSMTDLGMLPLKEFWAGQPLLRILCEQPAIWAVPLAIGLMVLVSKATQSTIPADIRMKMLVLHAPEKLGLKQEYIQEHHGH
ncbi:cation acetate symporter [bacterium]|nr:cation acetate symporter [bacterium]